MVDRTGLEPV